MALNNASNRPAPESLAGQIAELKRESAMRRQVYPRMIDAGRLKFDQAAHQVKALDAAIETLIRLAQREGGKYEGR